MMLSENNHMDSSPLFLRKQMMHFICLTVVSLLSLFAGSVQAAVSIDKDTFDHFTTGFPLSGAHIGVACDSCHVRGIFSGAPTTCGGCHNGRVTDGKSNKHIATTSACDDCHTTFSWEGASVDHTVVKGTCRSCHARLPAGHIQVLPSAQCEECHGTIDWNHHTKVDHDMVVGSCFSCHKKPVNHIASSNQCDDCHNTREWRNAQFDHNNLTLPCAVCHQKPVNHIASSSQCDQCHSTQAWLPATFDHSNITQPCASCHDKSTDHLAASNVCDECHRTTSWTPVSYSHVSGDYPGNHNSSVTCTSCHRSSLERSDRWTNNTFKPSCAGCHSDLYRSGDHDGRSLSQNQDCGSSGCHRVSGRGWD